MAWESGSGPRRVFIEDARRNGQFLRVTWHADRQQFVVSNWDDTVCVGATRVPVAQAGDLVGVLAAGLAETAGARDRMPAAGPRTLVDHIKSWWRTRGQTSVASIRHGVTERLRRSA